MKELKFCFPLSLALLELQPPRVLSPSVLPHQHCERAECRDSSLAPSANSFLLHTTLYFLGVVEKLHPQVLQYISSQAPHQNAHCAFLFLSCDFLSYLRRPGFDPWVGRSLEKGMATHSSVLAWKIPWIEEPSRLLSMASWRVGQKWAINTFKVSFSSKLYVPFNFTLDATQTSAMLGIIPVIFWECFKSQQ